MSALLSGLVVGGVLMAVTIAIAIVIGQRQLGRHRGVSREAFVHAFTETDVPREIPTAVYDFYKARVLSKDFSVAPDDSYEHALHEGEEDIGDDARLLMKKLGLKPPSQDVWEQWAQQVLAARRNAPNALSLAVDSSRWLQPIQTLRDMVMWLNWVRQHQ